MIAKSTDTIVVGGGIVGLACALAAVRDGKTVVLFERNEKASGASVRNFGLIWPVGQPEGPLHDIAMRSREIWQSVIQEAGLWNAPSGSLHLAHHADEEQVLFEYLDDWSGDDFGRRMMLPREVDTISSSVSIFNLRSALWSPTEINIDPREVIAKIPLWLEEQHNVTLRLGHAVTAIGPNRVSTKDEVWEANEVIVCSGADFEQFFPEAFRESTLEKVKLQMLRTVPQPDSWQLGPTLCAGLTLIHYPAFKACTSLDLLMDGLKRRHEFCIRHGIHLLVSQTRFGEVTLGDSHCYGSDIGPFDREDINSEIIDGFRRFGHLPKLDLQERWHGIYAKHPTQPWFVANPQPGVTIVNGLGGAGMTFSFGLAEAILKGGVPSKSQDASISPTPKGTAADELSTPKVAGSLVQ